MLLGVKRGWAVGVPHTPQLPTKTPSTTKISTTTIATTSNALRENDANKSGQKILSCFQENIRKT